MLRLDGPDCTLTIRPSGGYSPTRLVLEVRNDGPRQHAAVELDVTDVQAVATELNNWLEDVPTSALPMKLRPSPEALP